MNNKTNKFMKVSDFDIENFSYKRVAETKAQTQKAVIYCRVSGMDQVKHGSGIESQEEICRKFCENNGYEIVKIFYDLGVSGAKTTRLGLDTAINFLNEKNKYYPAISYLVVTEGSRISRAEELFDSLALEREIVSTGVEIIEAFKGKQVKTEASDIINIINKRVDSKERKNIMKRTRAGLTTPLANGERKFATIPFGYTNEGTGKNRKIIPNQKLAENISIGFTQLAYGQIENVKQLCERFTKIGVLNKIKGTDHCSPKHHERLSSPFIIFFLAGHLIMPKYGIDAPMKAQHEPIISLELALKCISRIYINSDKKTITKRIDWTAAHPLRGFLVCQNCGWNLSSWNSKGRNQYYSYYGCKNPECKKQLGKGVMFRIEQIHKNFLEYFEQKKLPTAIWEAFELALGSVMKDLESEGDKIVSTLKKQIKDLDAEADSISEKILKLSSEGMINKLEKRFEKIETEKKRLSKKVFENEFDINNNYLELMRKVKLIFTNPRSIWETKKYSLIKLMIMVGSGEKFALQENGQLHTTKKSPLEWAFQYVGETEFQSTGPGWAGTSDHLVMSRVL